MLNYIQHHAASVILKLRDSQVYTDCDQIVREDDGALIFITLISDWAAPEFDSISTMQAIVRAAWCIEEDRPFPSIPWRPIDPEDQDFELPF